MDIQASLDVVRPGQHVDRPAVVHEATDGAGHILVPADSALGKKQDRLTSLADLKVIEIIPTDNAHPFYYSLALAAQLDYGYLVGRSIVEREAGGQEEEKRASAAQQAPKGDAGGRAGRYF